jgi:4-carboxymuconolactone decarboxylase
VIIGTLTCRLPLVRHGHAIRQLMKRTIGTLVTLALAWATPGEAQGTRELVITRAASRPSLVAPADNFTGTARVQTLFDTTATTRAYGATVVFDAGARTGWHTHARGQVLIVTAGVGRVQRSGGPVEEIRPGDVVRIPPGVKHWHGASPTAAMTHIAIVETLDGRSTDWMEKVTDAQYAAPPDAQRVAAPTTSGVAGDSVQPRSHLALARENGVTREELIEAITHLAFYAGWPNAITAVTVAREVFAGPGR